MSPLRIRSVRTTDVQADVPSIFVVIRQRISATTRGREFRSFRLPGRATRPLRIAVPVIQGTSISRQR